eukprot:c17312_g1_i1.p2 GENE.c17312_g1_i1~~c17312_g1_i1.p2  ORF type:complete len:120 (+),score=21.24 c17312_g1_i1:382-741(+)
MCILGCNNVAPKVQDSGSIFQAIGFLAATETLNDTPNAMDGYLNQILELEYVTALNICVNPLASVSRKDFFDKCPEMSLQKLIWIPEPWLDSENWHVLVEDRLISSINEAHQQYYREIC